MCMSKDGVPDMHPYDLCHAIQNGDADCSNHF